MQVKMIWKMTAFLCALMLLFGAVSTWSYLPVSAQTTTPETGRIYGIDQSGNTAYGTYTFDSETGTMTVQADPGVKMELDYNEKLVENNEIQVVVVGEGITSLTDSVFSWCNNLREVYAEHEDLKQIDSAFTACPNIELVRLGKCTVNIRSNSFRSSNGMTMYGYSGSGADAIPNIDYTFISLGGYGAAGENFTWEYSSSTKTLTFTGSGAMSGYLEDMLWRSADFATEIETVVLPEGITEISNYAFNGCTGIKNVNFPESLTYIGFAAFSGCINLTQIDLPESQELALDSYAFSGTGLTSVYVPANCRFHADDGVPAISIFEGCANLTEATIAVPALPTQMFNACSSLTTVTLLEGVEEIGQGAFGNCRELVEISFPSTLKSIGYQAFYGDTSLTDLTFQSGLESIGDQAFDACYRIHDVVLPDTVTSFGEDCFIWNASGIRIYAPYGSAAIEYAQTQGISPVPEGHDINSDRTYNILDIMTEAQVAVGKSTVEAADFNEDGRINVLDVMVMVRHLIDL